jgi:hypothetical protein
MNMTRVGLALEHKFSDTTNDFRNPISKHGKTEQEIFPDKTMSPSGFRFVKPVPGLKESFHDGLTQGREQWDFQRRKSHCSLPWAFEWNSFGVRRSLL